MRSVTFFDEAELQRELKRHESAVGGRIRLCARRIATGETVAFGADDPVKAASVIKLPILAHVALLMEEGAIRADEPLTMREADKVPGTGVLSQLTAPLSLPLWDLCTLMTIVSDNTATNLVIDRVGIEPVNARMLSLGIPNTRLLRKTYQSGPPASEENAQFGIGVTTARDMVNLLTMLAQERIGSTETGRRILNLLSRQQLRNGIPRLLPEDYLYAGKTGSLDLMRNDVGLVTAPDGEQVAMALFCGPMPRSLWSPDNPGLLSIAQLAKRLLGA